MTDLRVNNINIASQYSVNKAEQVAQTTESQNSVFETAKVETAKKDDKKNATVTNQVKAWYGLSDEAWDKMTIDEKAAKSAIYIQQAVANHNAANKSDLTIERQYEIYLERSQTAEEREILTLLTLNFKDDERQYKLAKMSVNSSRNDKERNVAEKTLAGNYHRATVKNQARFAQDIVKEFAQENVEIAAQNASKTDVKVQEEVVKSFLSANNVKINNIIESQIDLFGIDNEGKINEAIRNACANEIRAAKAEIEARQAVKVEETKTVETKIQNTTSNEEVKENEEEVKEVEENKEVAKSEITITEEKIATINALLKENNNSSVEKNVKEMTTQEKLALLDTTTDITVINAILNSNPSFIVLNKIQKILNRMDVKEINNDVIANANEDTQIEKIQQAASQNRLQTINKFCLTAKAKRVYDQIA